MRHQSGDSQSARAVTMVSALCAVMAVVAVSAGVLATAFNDADFLALASLPPLALAFALAAFVADRGRRPGVVSFALFALVCGAIAILLRASPEFMWGWHVNVIIHRSLLSGLGTVILGVVGLRLALFQYLGATPGADDTAVSLLVAAPVVFVLAVYGLLLAYVVLHGAPPLNSEVLTTPYKWLHWREMVYENAWPVWQSMSIELAGMRNHVLGTLLLAGLTCLFALPSGLGVGLYLGEYGNGYGAYALRFSVSLLRAMSVLILGLSVASVALYANGTFLSDILCGFYFDPNGVKHTGHGSYVLAAGALALLVIPVIARATEDGCKSLPRDIREASVALGATEGRTVTRIVLPWCMPNVLTSLLLGCAEAAGAVAVVLFVARAGQYGVGPFNEVTSLAYLIFDVNYGTQTLQDVMRPFEYSAALLLLLLTLGLSGVALWLRQRFAWRYRSR